MSDPSTVVFWVFLAIFVATAVITLLGLINRLL